MKHLMAFFILFSALSSSWAGVSVYSVTQAKNTLSVTQMALEKESVAPGQPQEHLTHHCSSMSPKVNPVQKVDYAYCVNCFDQCQCDESTCHKLNSPLVGTHLEHVNIQGIAKISPPFVSPQLQKAPVFLDFRPPKIS